MGKCEYVLAKDSSRNWFEVRQVNEPCGSGRVSCTKSVSVIFPRIVIDLRRGSVAVNGTLVSLPANYEGKSIFLLNVAEIQGYINGAWIGNHVITRAANGEFY